MRRFGRLTGSVACLVAVLLSTQAVWAKEKKSKKKAEPPPAATQESSTSAQLAAERQELGQARKALDGTRWAMELTPMSKEKPKPPGADFLRFQKGKVSSEKLLADGFAETNYSLSVGSDGVPVWETMQTSPDARVASWRGELYGEKMRGVLSRVSTEGTVEDWAFSARLSPLAPPPEPSSPSARVEAKPPARKATR